MVIFLTIWGLPQFVSYSFINRILIPFGEQLSPFECSLRVGICPKQSALHSRTQEIDVQSEYHQSLSLKMSKMRRKKNHWSLFVTATPLH